MIFLLVEVKHAPQLVCSVQSAKLLSEALVFWLFGNNCTPDAILEFLRTHMFANCLKEESVTS